MNKEIKSGVVLDVCPICDSVWLDKNELEMIEDKKSKPHSELLKELYTETTNEVPGRLSTLGVEGCPKCGKAKLELKTAHDVEIDFCPACEGTFFDWDELSDLLKARAELV